MGEGEKRGLGKRELDVDDTRSTRRGRKGDFRAGFVGGSIFMTVGMRNMKMRIQKQHLYKSCIRGIAEWTNRNENNSWKSGWPGGVPGNKALKSENVRYELS
jgi:hypothetical protein